MKRNMLFLPQADEHCEDIFPAAIAGKVVVGEEIKIEPVPVIVFANGLPPGSSGERTRISRPCTLMIEQKLQLKGHPRLQSIVPKFEMMNRLRYFRSTVGKGCA